MQYVQSLESLIKIRNICPLKGQINRALMIEEEWVRLTEYDKTISDLTKMIIALSKTVKQENGAA